MEFYCNECEEDISANEFRFSMKNFGRPLCRQHQPRDTQKLTSRKSSHSPTKEAIQLCQCLRALGWNAELEKFDGFKHIDIAIVEAQTNIEIDGIHHNSDKDQALTDLKRTYHSWRKGYVTLRIPNCLVRDKKTIEETAEYIDKFLDTSLKQLEDEEW